MTIEQVEYNGFKLSFEPMTFVISGVKGEITYEYTHNADGNITERKRVKS